MKDISPNQDTLWQIHMERWRQRFERRQLRRNWTNLLAWIGATCCIAALFLGIWQFIALLFLTAQ